MLEVLRKNNIITEYIPNNMTNYYQQLDCTINQHLVYQEVQSELKKGTSIEDISIKFPLTMMKPLHANWIIQMYNELTSKKGKKVIQEGWAKSGIFDTIMLRSKNLPSLDSFEEIEPLDSECTIIDVPQ